MKKALIAFLSLLLLVSLMACGTPAAAPVPAPTPTPTQTEPAKESIVLFTDQTLEAMVRDAMGKTEGDITVAEAKTVTSLNLAFPQWQTIISEREPIRSIVGLENFSSLETLDLSGNALTDITPLSALTSLKALILTGCAAEDYTPLANLTNLRVLYLDHSLIADPAPLLSLSELKCLYLDGSGIHNYLPLADIRASLELADFDVAFTLAEASFTFNDNDKMAVYEVEEYEILMNHAEWGDPPQQDWMNCIRVVAGSESGYKIDVGFYPEHNAYVVWMVGPDAQLKTYVFDVATNSFNCERADMELIVREAFGDVNDKDVLLTPILFFDSIMQDGLGIPVDILYNMPFDENIVLRPRYEKLGFEFIDFRGAYSYQENGMEICIHKPEWDGNVEEGSVLDWSISFFEPDVKGYELLILYFADKDVYFISLVKDGIEIRFDYYPAENRFDFDPQSIDAFRSALNEAFHTQGDDFMNVPMSIFRENVQQRFGMSIEELYALE